MIVRVGFRTGKGFLGGNGVGGEVLRIVEYFRAEDRVDDEEVVLGSIAGVEQREEEGLAGNDGGVRYEQREEDEMNAGGSEDDDLDTGTMILGHQEKGLDVEIEHRLESVNENKAIVNSGNPNELDELDPQKGTPSVSYQLIEKSQMSL